MAKQESQSMNTPPQAEPPVQAQALPKETGYVWPSEYRPPDPTRIVNQQPGWKYRLLSKKKIEREGGSTRDWEIVQGNSPEHSIDPEARRLMGTGSPHGVNAPDTTRHVGDLIVGRMPVEYAEKRNAYYRREANDQVQDALRSSSLDEKDKKDMAEDLLRRAGLDASLVKRFLDSGGAMVMNPQE